jgi:pilus assembly protein CpaF
MRRLLDELHFGRRGDGDENEYVRERRQFADRRHDDRRRYEKEVGENRRSESERRGKEDRRATARSREASSRVTIKPIVHALGQKVEIYKANDRSKVPESLRPHVKEVHDKVCEIIDLTELSNLKPKDQKTAITDAIIGAIEEMELPIHGPHQQDFIETLLSDFLGLGPLEPLLADGSVSDIMVNGPDKVWVEREGKLHLTDVKFHDPTHLMGVVNRIISRVNRRIDEASPMVDARLVDGSRINVIIPPLSVRFPSVSIRKFLDRNITLDHLVERESLSADMALMFKIFTKYRLNVLISGGTGTGKTTLLGAMARHIDPTERVVTIEDTAELRLTQPNTVELESRPPNIEGAGEVTLYDLLRNALRMRPDRIIVGEVRGPEAAEMLQAMNTGHDGSLGTIHANSARDALDRFENIICMSDKFEPGSVTRQQIVNALDAVVHLTRMHDGSRRVTQVCELVALESGLIKVQDIFTFEFVEERDDGSIVGEFTPTLVRPRFIERIKFYNLAPDERALLDRFNVLV